MSDMREGNNSNATSDPHFKVNDKGELIQVKALESELATPEEIEWCAFGRQQMTAGVARCERSGKALFQILGFLVPGYMICLYAIAGMRSIPTLLLCPLGFWFTALVLSLIALLPWSWHAGASCPDEIKNVFKRMAMRKWRLVRISALLFLLGMVVMIIGQTIS